MRYTLWKSGTPELAIWRDSIASRNFWVFWSQSQNHIVPHHAWAIYQMQRSIAPKRSIPRAIAMVYTRENVGLS